jgi:hypothetical protein
VAEVVASADVGASDDDLADLAGAKLLDRLNDREIGLAGAGRAGAKRMSWWRLSSLRR